jgi:hypothetical protein
MIRPSQSGQSLSPPTAVLSHVSATMRSLYLDKAQHALLKQRCCIKSADDGAHVRCRLATSRSAITLRIQSFTSSSVAPGRL